MPEVLNRAEELTGVSPPPAVPGAVFRLLGTSMKGVERFTRPPDGLESETLHFFASGGVFVDNSKARAALDIDHRPLDTGLETYLVWELDQQGMEATGGRLS